MFLRMGIAQTCSNLIKLVYLGDNLDFGKLGVWVTWALGDLDFVYLGWLGLWEIC